MREIVLSSRFKRDLKLIVKRGYDLNLLDTVVEKLANDIPLEERHRDHALTGSRTGVEPNCPTTMHFRIFRRAFTRKIYTLLRKIAPKSIKNAFAGGCKQF